MLCCYLAGDIAVKGFLALSTFGQAFFSVDDKETEQSFVVLYSIPEKCFGDHSDTYEHITPRLVENTHSSVLKHPRLPNGRTLQDVGRPTHFQSESTESIHSASGFDP